MFENIEKNSKNIVYIYTTCGNIEEAKSIGFSAIKGKLAVSMDYWVVNSMYPWKNVIKEINQCMLVLSTQKVLSEKLIKHIELKHSYNVPMIARCDTSMTNEQYNFWANITLSSKEEYLTEFELKNKNRVKEGLYAYERLK